MLSLPSICYSPVKITRLNHNTKDKHDTHSKTKVKRYISIEEFGELSKTNQKRILKKKKKFQAVLRKIMIPKSQDSSKYILEDIP